MKNLQDLLNELVVVNRENKEIEISKDNAYEILQILENYFDDTDSIYNYLQAYPVVDFDSFDDDSITTDLQFLMYRLWADGDILVVDFSYSKEYGYRY